MYPTLENIREIAAKGQYKRVTGLPEVYADRYTPVEVMRILRKASRHCICWKVPARQKCGDAILSSDTNR